MMHPRMTTQCDRELEVMHAAQAGREPDPALRAHLQTCAACRELFDVASYMTRLAAGTDALAASRALPEPGQLWWKARLLQRWEAETRATAPVDWMQRVEVAAGLFAAIVLLLMLWFDFRGVQSAARPEHIWTTIAGLLAPAAVSSFIAGGLLLIGCLALFTLRQLLTEE